MYGEAVGNGLRESLHQTTSETPNALISQQLLRVHLVNIAQELATNVLATCLLVVEDTRRGGLVETLVNHHAFLDSEIRTKMMIPN